MELNHAQGIEEVGRFFDSCDKARVGVLRVSSLISAFRQEVGNREDDPDGKEKENFLKTIQILLDPLGENIEIDKASWVAAWKRQADLQESPSKRTLNIDMPLQAEHDSSELDDKDVLNQSKQSYCYSPHSDSSILNGDTEELKHLREEKEYLLQTLKNKDKQLLLLEENLNQELLEKEELEKILNDQIDRLTKQNKILTEQNADLKMAFDAIEKEKLELCETLNQLNERSRDLETELTSRNLEISNLNELNDKISKLLEDSRYERNELEEKIHEQVFMFAQQIKDYQEAYEMAAKERDDLKNEIECSSSILRSLSPVPEEYDAVTTATLQEELDNLTQPIFEETQEHELDISLKFEERKKIQIPSMKIPSMEIPSMEIPSMEIPSMEIPSMKIPSMKIPSMCFWLMVSFFVICLFWCVVSFSALLVIVMLEEVEGVAMNCNLQVICWLKSFIKVFVKYERQNVQRTV